MKKLVAPSPIMLDQSFPRNQDELSIVAIALGALIEMMENGDVEVLLTDTLRDFIELFEWNQPENASLLSEIYRLISLLFLQEHDGVLRIDVTTVTDSVPHLIPARCVDFGFVAEWSVELGKVLKLHDEKFGPESRYHVGICCAYCFAGEMIDSYQPPVESRRFPLVGPADMCMIEPSFTWRVDPTIRQATVTPEDFIRNQRVLGVARIKRSPGSHRKVYFLNGKTWTLDMNWVRIDDSIIRELESICDLPAAVIKSVIRDGELPQLNRLFP